MARLDSRLEQGGTNMARQEQVKTGYLRGVRGALITVLNADGSLPSSPEKYWVDTSQEATVEATMSDAESDNLRGGDRILVTLQEDSKITGVSIGFTDARFDAQLSTIIAGGKLITETTGVSPDTVTKAVGWDAPMMAESDDRVPFQIDIYVSNYTSGGRKDGYLCVTSPNCTGTVPNMSFADQTWAAEAFTITGSENTKTNIPAVRKKLVDALPTEAVTPAEIS